MIEHQQHVQRLAAFCGAIAGGLLKDAVLLEQVADNFRLGVSAECVQCAIRVSGEELFLLAQPACTDEHPKIKRMRLGDCARHGCDSCYYRLRFWPVGSLDWSNLLSEIQARQVEPPQEGPSKFSNLASRFFSFAPSRKIWLALGLLVLLFTIRQWHRGGRIPFIREPEQFRVDIAPQDESERPEIFKVDVNDPQSYSRVSHE